MTTQANATIHDQGRAAEAFSHWVLLAPPTTRTIPIFSLQVEAGRPANEVWSISPKDERAVLDRQALGRLRAGAFGDYQFLTTRHKRLREARYATWLAFSDREGATAFVTVFPRYGLINLLAAAQRRIATIEHDLQQGLTKGRYDLGGLEHADRYHRAKLYVTSRDELRRLRGVRQGLELLRDQPAEWFGCFERS